ncbi:uncharacterized protein [Bemisia tabaci]|uniref:uncharacterized protein n=1 Tax=Bemisia tabaci TaxID=7038 RepID=UPI003B287C84
MSLLSQSQHPKNIIFFLKETNDIFSLILATASQENEITNYPDISANFSDVIFEHDTEKHVPGELPNYCVVYNSAESEQKNGSCDFRVDITPAELDGRSPLTDDLLILTRGLYSHDVWNYENHIVFIVDEQSWRKLNADQKCPGIDTPDTTILTDAEIDSCNLIFLFDLFWRFFRGQRTTICFETYCVWYDRFEGRLDRYEGTTDERYFDFSFRGYRDKKYTVAVTYDDGSLMSTSAFWGATPHIIFEVIRVISRKIGSKENYYNLPEDSIIMSTDDGLRHNVDLIVYESSYGPKASELPRSHHPPIIDSFSYCLLAPRRGFMPQYLVVVKCFSPPVWVATVMAIGTSWFMQWLFQWSQVTHFTRFYSDAEILAYEESPAFLTIYSYLLNGSPPVLLLGKLLTGKVCFLVFTFFSLIVGTVIQSGMTTLLSSYVRYADIETLQELEQSGLYIQTPDTEMLPELLEQSGHASLRDRLTKSKFYYDELFPDPLSELEDTRFREFLPLQNNTSELKATLMKSVDMIMETDAFAARVPYSLLSVKNRIPVDANKENIELHLIDECLVTYPFSYLIVKNSILTEIFDESVHRLLENGVMADSFRADTFETQIYFGYIAERNSGEGSLRPFSMIDLQLAFISLGIGYLISFMAFVIELYVGLSK